MRVSVSSERVRGAIVGHGPSAVFLATLTVSIVRLLSTEPAGNRHWDQRLAASGIAPLGVHASGLFGQPAPVGESGARPLGVTLVGTLAYEDAPDRGFAIVQVDGHTKLVAVGAEIGGARVEAVYPERIVLVGANGLAEVMFNPGNASPSTRRRYTAPPPAVSVAALEDRIDSAIKPLESVLKATPLLNGGRYSGLIVSPNGNQAAFRSLGLQPDDVIVAVNRIQLNENSLNVLSDAVKSRQPVKVWVVRPGAAGQELTLNTAVLGY